MKKPKDTLQRRSSPNNVGQWSVSDLRLRPAYVPSREWKNGGVNVPRKRFSYSAIHQMIKASQAPQYGNPDLSTGRSEPDNNRPARSSSDPGAISNPLADRHYDEGLTCWQKEMQDEAIACFKKALINGKKPVSCHLMMALCCMKKANYKEAIEHLRAGLEVEGISKKQTLALNYKIGQCNYHLRHPADDFSDGAINVESDSNPTNRDDGKSAKKRQKTDAQIVPFPGNASGRTRMNTDPPVIWDNPENESGRLKIWVAVVAAGIAFFVAMLNFDYLSDRVNEVETTSPGISLPAEQSGESTAEDRNARSPHKTDEPASYTPEGNDSQQARPEKKASDIPSVENTITQEFHHDRSLIAKIAKKNWTVARGKPVYIISGRVINSDSIRKSGIIVEGTIFDKEGNVLDKAQVPCGSIHRYKIIQQTRPQKLRSLFEKDGNPYDCSVGKGSYNNYQLIFSNAPKDLPSDARISLRAGTFDLSGAKNAH